MRFQVISLFQVSQRADPPFTLWPLTDIDEYRCFLYRCEGEMPLHRHLEHDELLWPQDQPMALVHQSDRMTVPAGQIVRVGRGWKHGSAASRMVHVMMISRGERSLAMNGHYEDLHSLPPERVDPIACLAGAPSNTPQPLLRCDNLQLYVERITATGPGRRAAGDHLVVPLGQAIGLRCGGVVAIVADREVARVPAGCSWNLFGEGVAVWMRVERSGEQEALEQDG